MKLAEYAVHDGLGLAELVRRREVAPRELAQAAAAAIEAVNPALNAVVERYADRIDGLDEASLDAGPFRGVPFLIKDVFGHEKGRLCEFGSRLCRGMVGTADSNLAVLLRSAGFNVLGRSTAPEFSMAGTTEGVLYGNASTPWRPGYSAGGSSGGAAAAVAAGIVPLAHGSDIGGSIRIPASMCGGVGFKPSRMRISMGPMLDEPGWGYTVNFAQTRSIRDAAALLDCLAIPMIGDPFVIPKPAESYAVLAERAPQRLRIGIALEATSGVAPDPEVAEAVRLVGRRLEGLGHHVEEVPVSTGGVDLLAILHEIFFFDFDNRLDGYAARTGLTPGPDTLEPAMLAMYRHARTITPARFTAAWAAANVARRALSAGWSRCDLWLSPTTARTAEPWGRYNLGRADADARILAHEIWAPVTQYTVPHNLMGTPAISLPLVMHSNGLPIGIQLAAAPAMDHLVLQIARVLEQEMPWAGRQPPVFAGNS